MRTMFDAVTPANIPANPQMVAGYIDGRYAWTAADWARFPGAVKVRIATSAATNDGHAGDGENGDMSPQRLVDWVQMRRAAGADPTGYCSESSWSAYRAAFTARGVPEPHWWIAGYPGSVGAGQMYPGSVAHQYEDHQNLYDISAVADHWPGVDTTNPPPAGGDVPAPTDVVDIWVLPGTNGAIRAQLHADGGLFCYGGLNPLALRYTAYGNDGSEYDFPFNGTVISYPGLPPAARQGNRYFISMHVISYNGVNYETGAIGAGGPPGATGPQGAAGPPGPQGPPGSGADDDSALDIRITALEGDVARVKAAIQ